MSEQQKHDLMGILSQGGLDLSADVPTLRAAFNELMARVPVAGDVDQKPTTIGGVNAIDVTIRGLETAGTILYFHGGVYVIGSAMATVPLVSDLARRTHAGVVTVDYRLAPEYPYPAAVPKSMLMLAPVMGAADGLARKNTSSATSSGVMNRAFSPCA